MIEWILGVILTITVFTLERFFPHVRAKKSRAFVSFAAGIAITYVLLVLLPESYRAIEGLERISFFAAIVSFTLIYLLEKHVFLQTKRDAKRAGECKNLHLAYFFVYNVSVGALLYHFAQSQSSNVFLFFFPFLLYGVIEVLPPLFRFHDLGGQVLYSATPLYGIALAGVARFSDLFYTGLISFVAGGILYLAARESIAPETRNRPGFFTLGVMVYAAIILAFWAVQGF